MSLSPTAQATLLLTSYFSKANSTDAKPLTNIEWGRFATWLKDRSMTPADLLVSEPEVLLNAWSDSHIGIERILQLLNRGHSLALAMEKWQRAGLWVVTRSDPEYPRRLKQRLKTGSPPVLFGCGDRALLNAGGLAVIGSRNANETDLAFTERVGAKAASEGIAIVSGGARGVDEAAMLGAVSAGGWVIGVMADSLLKAATSAKWREGLMAGGTVLVSPFYPEAGFNVGNAMARNKYIYCLADSSLVIHSGKKGGTLSGAEENLARAWVPLWIKPSSDKNSANADLVAKGGRWCESDIQSLNIAALVASVGNMMPDPKNQQANLFSLDEYPHTMSVLSDAVSEPLDMTQHQGLVYLEQDKSSHVSLDFFRLFLEALHRLAQSPVTQEQLLDSTQLHKSQLNDWLKRATDAGVVKKLNRPVRYQWVKDK